jgi:hypothetical protein
VDAEVLKEKHSPPIVEGGLFKPGVAVEIRSDAGAKAVAKGMGGVEPAEHLVGDLRVARLVRADEAEAIAAEDRREAVEQEKEDEAENDRYFADGAGSALGEGESRSVSTSRTSPKSNSGAGPSH